MYLPNCLLKFEGLMVTRESRRLIGGMLERLQCNVPSDSFIKLTIIKGESGASGVLKISSSDMNLNLVHKATDSLSVARFLAAKMNRKIVLWHKGRIF